MASCAEPHCCQIRKVPARPDATSRVAADTPIARVRGRPPTIAAEGRWELRTRRPRGACGVLVSRGLYHMLAPTMGLNPYAKVFYPRGMYGLSLQNSSSCCFKAL